MNTMSHKGYTARVEYDERDNILVGRQQKCQCSRASDGSQFEMERHRMSCVDGRGSAAMPNKPEGASACVSRFPAQVLS